MIRIVNIPGRRADIRRERLSRLKSWMGSHGWILADYSEEAGQAMFERGPGAGGLPPWHSTRWLPMPAAWHPKNWGLAFTAEPRLAIPPAALVLALLLGWMMPAVSSLMESSHLPAAEEQQAEKWRVVIVERLNVREAPTTDSQIVGFLYQDQRVLVEGEVDRTWVKIGLPKRGYVAQEFLIQSPPGTGGSP